MKRFISMFLTVVFLWLCSVSAFAQLPPWLRKDGDRIVHVEGRDEKDPTLAYDEKGSVYSLQAIYVGFTCDDFEKAKQFGRELIEYAKSLAGVTDAASNDFDYHEGWENYYLIRVALAYPYDDYEAVFDALKAYPGVTRVQRMTLDTSAECRYYYGDVDFNGAVTTADARSILRYCVSLDRPEAYHVSFGDFNADGKLTTADARSCLRVSVGLDPMRIYDGN